MFKRAAQAAIKFAKVAIKATVKAVKATIAVFKETFALIIAGGWVAVAIIIVVCVAAVIVGRCILEKCKKKLVYSFLYFINLQFHKEQWAYRNLQKIHPKNTFPP